MSEDTPQVVGAEDPYTAMTTRFGLPARLFGRRFFSRFALDPSDTKQLSDLEERGAVVYVMRYSSRLDYFLCNWLFLASGLRPASCTNGIWFFYYRPLGEALRLGARWLWDRVRLGRAGVRERGMAALRRSVREGQSAFLFLRTDKMTARLGPRRGALESGRSELDRLHETVDMVFATDRPVALVPLAMFWRKGARAPRPFLDLFYGDPQRPTSLAKVLSFLWNYDNLAVRVGTPIDLRGFVDERRAEGRERVAKQVRRSLLIFLRREEKPVAGASLRTFERIEQAVLADPDVVDAINELRSESKQTPARLRARASRMLRGIAAHPSPTMLAVLSVIVTWMVRRLFGRFEVHGLERVVEAAKLHPLVLVPTHRSHFDYVILSWLFYRQHLVPPHVAAGDNLSFWPLGPIFRRAGAFFLRRSFDGDLLYSAVFRSYVKQLIKDGATQEFFIEGTRSRTGKTLQPKLGMLRMVLEAYARGARRELYLVPVGFTYERLVEEGAMTDERRGVGKGRENLAALLGARSVLRRRFGEVSVRFGTPLEVSAIVGQNDGADLRGKTAELGLDISRRLNALVTASRSAVASAALLGDAAEALRVEDFSDRVREIDALLLLLGMPRSAPLVDCLAAGRVERVAEPLLRAERLKRRSSPRGDLIEIPDGVRNALDYYRATLLHSLSWPAALALVLPDAGTRAEVLDRAEFWIGLLEREFFPVEGPARRERLERVLDHLVSRGWVEAEASGALRVTRAGGPWRAFWAGQLRPLLECYRATFTAVDSAGGEGTRKALVAAAQDVQREQLVLGEARYREGPCAVGSGNALDLLLEAEILAPAEPGRRGDPALQPGPKWGDLAELRAAFAALLQHR